MGIWGPGISPKRDSAWSWQQRERRDPESRRDLCRAQDDKQPPPYSVPTEQSSTALPKEYRGVTCFFLRGSPNAPHFRRLAKARNPRPVLCQPGPATPFQETSSAGAPQLLRLRSGCPLRHGTAQPSVEGERGHSMALHEALGPERCRRRCLPSQKLPRPPRAASSLPFAARGPSYRPFAGTAPGARPGTGSARAVPKRTVLLQG